MELRHFQLSESLEDIARVGVVFFKSVSNGASSAVISKRLESLADELRQAIGERQISELESVKQTRKLYHALGIDPTHDRPSSERLLRRVIQNRPLPRISKLVDTVNLASLSLQCPMGVYDWDKVQPPVLVRVGRPDDSLVSWNGEPVSLEGRIALVDGEGLFGNPSRDAQRTQVTFGTVRAVVVAWASAETPKNHVEAALKEIIDLGRELCDARPGEWGILG